MIGSSGCEGGVSGCDGGESRVDGGSAYSCNGGGGRDNDESGRVMVIQENYINVLTKFSLITVSLHCLPLTCNVSLTAVGEHVQSEDA